MKRKNQLSVIALCLLVCLCVSMAACNGGGGETTPSGTSGSPETSAPENVTYTVQIQAENGTALADVGVFIYTDASQSDLVWFEKTDENGVMHFTAPAGTYVAVLNNVPEAYEAAESYDITDETVLIQLAAGSMGDDMADVVLGLGDMMVDFSVTDPEGTVYTLSELLAQKDAVVLNFWYISCAPCKMEFPYLQEAYERYSNSIEVLAMNPVNADDGDIAQYKSDMGLSFPVVKCDLAWEKMMQIVGYPTTVVVDKNGTIALIHTGSIPSAETFEAIFAYFTDDNYDGVPVANVEDLPQPEERPLVGNADSPIEVGGVTSFEVTVEPGHILYYHVYKVSGTYMSLNNSSIYLEYNGKTFEPTGGKIGTMVESDDITSPVKLAFANPTEEAQTFTVYFSALPGTYSNPYTLELGEFSTSSAAGNDQGVYYTYTADKDGVLTVECLSVTKGVDYDYILYNLTTSAYRTMKAEGDGRSVSVKVSKGDKVTVTIGALPDSENSYPAAKFTSLASFSDGTEDQEPEETVPTVTYSVTVTDETRKPLASVFVYLEVEGEQVTLQTNESGVAYTTLPAGTYAVTVKVPAGYTGNTTQFQLSEAYPNVSVKMDTIVETVMLDYTVTVLDAKGNPVAGAMVSVGNSFGFTDAKGQVIFRLEEGQYQAAVNGPDGVTYILDFATGATELTVNLQPVQEPEVTEPAEPTEPSESTGPSDVTEPSGTTEPSEGTEPTEPSQTAPTEPAVTKVRYSVTVQDYAGSAISDAVVIFYHADGSLASMSMVDAKGVAAAELEEGSYTASVSFSGDASRYHYDTTAVKLTADAPDAKVCVAQVISGEFKQMYFGDLYTVAVGSTYTKLQSGVVNYFVFSPEKAGLYRVSLVESVGSLSYWGGNMNFVSEQTAGTNMENNSFTINVKENAVGNIDHILGVTGDDDCVIVITRIGDPVLDATDAEWIVYTASKTPTQYTHSGGKLTYVDLTAKSVKLVKGSDGYYHLNTKNGPLVLVNLGTDAPYVSMYTMLGGSGIGGTALRKYFYDDNGSFLKKEDYTSCMLEYINCRDSATGVYPLNDDLMYMLQNGGDQQGWWDETSGSYLFSDVKGLNPEIAWMFACCYVAK